VCTFFDLFLRNTLLSFSLLLNSSLQRSFFPSLPYSIANLEQALPSNTFQTLDRAGFFGSGVPFAQATAEEKKRSCSTFTLRLYLNSAQQ
jgi:hypothetical protein